MNRPAPLVLGTAQLTTRYGVTSARSSEPTEGESFELLATAAAAGIATVDTAPVYGDAELVRSVGARGAVPSAHEAPHRTRRARVAGGIGPSARRAADQARTCSTSTIPTRSSGPTGRSSRRRARPSTVRACASVRRSTSPGSSRPRSTIRRSPWCRCRATSSIADSRAAPWNGQQGPEPPLCSVAALLQGTLASAPEHLPAAVNYLGPVIRDLAEIANSYGYSIVETRPWLGSATSPASRASFWAPRR